MTFTELKEKLLKEEQERLEGIISEDHYQKLKEEVFAHWKTEKPEIFTKTEGCFFTKETKLYKGVGAWIWPRHQNHINSIPKALTFVNRLKKEASEEGILLEFRKCKKISSQDFTHIEIILVLEDYRIKEN